MLLVASDPAFEHHDTGPGHPERARRLTAALRGPEVAGLKDAVRFLEPREATPAELSRVHPADYLEAIEAFCGRGGGDIDGDTRVSAGSWRAGKLAAGAGLAAVEALRRGEGDAAFLAIRPPGHHALATRPMGFCIINNIAVVAPAVEGFAPTWVLVSAGYDAHRADPLAELGLSAGDFADLSRRVAGYAPGPGRLVLFLEGGYDLEALTTSVGASLAALADVPYRPEPATSGGPGAKVVEA